MKNFWDERYYQVDYVYGTRPNQFLRTYLDDHAPGRILLPGDGEGRNAVYAAYKGWNVDAFDSSEVGQEKALRLAKNSDVIINYSIDNYANYIPESGSYDLVALIFTHCDEGTRRSLHHKMIEALKPGGTILMETFSKAQLGKSSGGPKDAELLFSADQLKEDFSALEIAYLEEIETILNEGMFHRGEASVVRMIARKKLLT